MMNFPDPRFRESPPLQTYSVQSISVGSALGGCPREWQHIPRYGCAPADEGMRSYPHEVVYGAQCSNVSPVFHGYMPAQRRRVCHDDVTPNLAIMRNVGIGHDQVVVADLGASPALDRAAVDGDKLADYVMVADLQACRFACVGDVLRRQANRSEREKDVVRANFRGSLDSDVRNQAAALAELDLGPDNAIRPNLARRMYLAFRSNDRRSMDRRRMDRH